jgi:hypothetical protein
MPAGLFGPDSETATLTPFFLLFALALDIHPMGSLVSLTVCEATFLISEGIQLCSFGTVPDPTSDNISLTGKAVCCVLTQSHTAPTLMMRPSRD